MICLRRRNWPLAAGLLICGTWLLLAVIYPFLVAYPEPTGNITQVTDTGEGLRIRTAPFPPSLSHPLGTDERARDLLTRLLFGARLTLAATLAVALGRLVGAVPLGLWAATHPRLRWLVNQLASVSSALPPVILIMIVTRPLAWYHELPALPSAAALVAVMLVLGVPRVATGVAAHTQEVLARPFVVGAVAAGASRWRVVWRHVIPHLMPLLLLQAAAEAAAALWLFGQLGIASIFLGGTHLHFDLRFGGTMFASDFLGEWAGILAQGRRWIRSAPWLMLGPAACFALAAVGFNLVAEGLRRRLERRWEGEYSG